VRSRFLCLLSLTAMVLILLSNPSSSCHEDQPSRTKAIPNTGYLKWQGIALFYLFDDHISFNFRNLFERRDKSSYAFF
jgi:hypothetical protein